MKFKLNYLLITCNVASATVKIRAAIAWNPGLVVLLWFFRTVEAVLCACREAAGALRSGSELQCLPPPPQLRKKWS